MRGHLGNINPNQFSRATANINHQQLFRVFRNQWRARNGGELGLFNRFDNIQFQACFTKDLSIKLCGIAGPTAGFCCDQTHAGYIVLL